MQITYHGQSCFRIKGKRGTVVTDPFDEKTVGIPLSRLAADIVTISHAHPGHNAVAKVKADQREKPFVIDFAGEYEVGGVSVFGIKSYHDQVQGIEKGKNIIFKIVMDGLVLCHLGDLAHQLNEEQLKAIGMVDILFLPVGGPSSLMGEDAVKVAQAISPSIVIPMHYAGPGYPSDTMLKPLDNFLQIYGANSEAIDKLQIERDRLPEEMELVVLQRS
jgi:L-ascorbate metabolism protein UlaG (beta-lactamase superfamily)